MARCEKCGKIKLEDAECGICGGYLIKDGCHVTCPECLRDVRDVCSGNCSIYKIFKFIGIGFIILFLIIWIIRLL